MAPARKGLIIACNYPGTPHELLGPSNDAAVYEGILKHSGFSQVRVLSDLKLGQACPHPVNILRSARWLVSGAAPGDSLAFVVCGHGTLCLTAEHDHRDCHNRALCAASLDGDGETSLLVDRELQVIFAGLPAGVMLTCIMDCPFADSFASLPWQYDAKHDSFGKPKTTLRSSRWPGEAYGVMGGKMARCRQRGLKLGRQAAQKATLRGRAAANSQQPRDLFPGVAAFALCAARPDQLCYETQGIEVKSQGIFTASLAAVLQRNAWLHKVSMLASADADSATVRRTQQVTMLQLAQAIEAEVQSYIAGCGLEDEGVEQNVLLAFSADPQEVQLFEPPMRMLLPQLAQEHLQPLQDVEPSSILSTPRGGKWPYVLVQLCHTAPRGEDSGASMVTSEVIAEMWLPQLHKMFVEADAGSTPGTPRMPRGVSTMLFDQGKIRSRKLRVNGPLKALSLGDDLRRYTWSRSAVVGCHSPIVSSPAYGEEKTLRHPLPAEPLSKSGCSTSPNKHRTFSAGGNLANVPGLEQAFAQKLSSSSAGSRCDLDLTMIVEWRAGADEMAEIRIHEADIALTPRVAAALGAGSKVGMCFLRFALCTLEEMCPDTASTRADSHPASFSEFRSSLVSPHLVRASQPLTLMAHEDGTGILRLEALSALQPKGAVTEPKLTVPICTASSLVELQRVAMALPVHKAQALQETLGLPMPASRTSKEHTRISHPPSRVPLESAA
mmetsp:Transcript_66774/g.159741  ORF Transcript_66774/g.159741 Transcript_66774/m.159741 type:complete len:724 (+) Transcript_66774:155-2326(+)|eukprot:CAMPEP_0178439850 /NCGR_PEP_ID=MMETSP0689_2-20121128/36409_1 /TAXON_ID=160604 /ORGANISM="Amphidinium massartii, Strain CS-259" /LENGTH=723 /DNA_ID=CAMNT_0020062473 /DNA_START=79 /DNA_END=2250 /DNA_ORIENTATION=+